MKEIRNNNLNERYLKSLDWVNDFFKYELEGREKSEQIALLEKFKNVASQLLKNI